MTDVDAKTLITEITRSLAEMIGAECPPGVGFTILLFEFGKEGFLSYASNATREDMARTLVECAQMIRAQENQRG